MVILKEEIGGRLPYLLILHSPPIVPTNHQHLNPEERKTNGSQREEDPQSREVTLVDDTTETQVRFNDDLMFDTSVLDKQEVEDECIYKAFKRVNTFVDYKTELVEESSKRAKAKKESSLKREGEGLESDNSKKQKTDDDQEEAEMKKIIEIVPELRRYDIAN
ncbi:hypothetical protein Tco_0642540 [Tanacetum coccineum]